MSIKLIPALYLLIFFFSCFYAFSLDIITSDMNSDGNADGWTYLKDGDIEKQEIDLNFDGKIDSVFLYESNGRVKEEILDTNYDGKMDNWRLYENGELVVDRVDSDLDGRIDIWIHVLKGKIILIEKDTTGDGKADKFAEY